MTGYSRPEYNFDFDALAQYCSDQSLTEVKLHHSNNAYYGMDWKSNTIKAVSDEVFSNSLTSKKEFSQIQDRKKKDTIVKEFINFYAANIYVESKLIVGAEIFLKWCKSNNISSAVCTNKEEHLAINLLKKIGIYKYLEYVAGRNTFDYCKPDPRHLTSIIEILKGDIKKTIMIGDSETDSTAAENASIPFVLLEGGYTNKNISQIKHDHLIKDFNGAEKIIQKYLND